MSQKHEMVTAQMKHTGALLTGSDRTVKHYMSSFAQLAVVAALALSIMVVPTGAAEAGATQKTDVEARAEAETSVKGFQGLMVSIDHRLKAIQNKLVSIETRLADLEAKIAANGNQESEADVNAESDANANAQADVNANAGAEVTHNVETGAETDAKAGARVEHNVEKNGKTFVDFVIGGLFGRSGSADISVEGDLEAGNQVMVTVTQNGEVAQNASVYANGEIVGHTDTNGQIELTVPSEERLHIVVKSDDFKARTTYNVRAETESSVELSSTTEEDASAEGDAEADGDANAESDASAESSGGQDSEESSGSAEGSSSVHAGAHASVS